MRRWNPTPYRRLAAGFAFRVCICSALLVAGVMWPLNAWWVRFQAVQKQEALQQALTHRIALERATWDREHGLPEAVSRQKRYLDRQEYLHEVQRLVAENRLRLTGCSVHAETNAVHLDLAVAGPYFQVVRLLHQLETHDLVMRIEGLQLLPQKDEVHAEITLNLWLVDHAG